MSTQKTEETHLGAAPEPITMGEGDLHCAPECSYLKLQPQVCMGICARDGKQLGFYDWYLAHCKGQYDELDVSSEGPSSSAQD